MSIKKTIFIPFQGIIVLEEGIFSTSDDMEYPKGTIVDVPGGFYVFV